MAVITPVGSDFDWSPKAKDETLVKAASTKTKGQPKAKPSDKDLLYAAAKKVVEAQFLELDKPCDDSPCTDVVEDAGEGGAGGLEGIGDMVPDVAPEAVDVGTEGEEGEEGGSGDVQEAVAELVEKAEKAEEVAAAVEEAVGKVEEAVQEVKDAVGGGIVDEIEIEIEDLDGSPEVEVEEKEDTPEEVEEKEDEEDDIIQESKEDVEASAKVLKMKSAAHSDDLAKFASLSPSVKKKIYDYWKNDLKYAPDYCKLLVTDS